MATKKAPKKQTIQPMSIQEFKIWIKGLSAFQDETWHPNKAQWDHIMDLIDQLKDSPSNVGYSVNPNAPISLPQAQPTSQPHYAGDAAVLTNNHVVPVNAPAPRFLGQQPASGRKSERDPLTGQPILEPHVNGKSDFT